MLRRNISLAVSNMELDSVWGKIRTRASASRMSRQEYLLLKDNPPLKPLFEWLRVNSTNTIDDVKPTCHQNKLLNTLTNFEVKFNFEDDRALPKIVFSNSVPFEGNFQLAIPEYLRTFYDIMYNPDVGYIPEVVK